MEPITDIDIKNWRWHFSGIPPEQQTGGDIFIQNCLDTIESLTAQLAEVTEQRDRYLMLYKTICFPFNTDPPFEAQS